jgi:outer membrane usher protein FimD/PapC
MSIRAPAARRATAFLVRAVFAAALLLALAAPACAAPAADAGPAAASNVATAPLDHETLFARVRVNLVGKGDVAILRDATGRVLVPAAEYARWIASPPPDAAIRAIGGERYVALHAVGGLDWRFDVDTVTLDVGFAAAALAGTRIDLAPPRRTGVLTPADTSFFLNYGLGAFGDGDLEGMRYQLASELGARAGQWLFYNTTNSEWNDGRSARFTRLLTSLQYDDRANLRRVTLGDFFTPSFELSGSVPMAGVNLAKLYSMDPDFLRYPTAAFATEVALPSTVEVRVDGNLVAERKVAPGPLDIANVTGVTGARNVSLVVRDPFGRERVVEQPFYFATNAGLAQGLHEYSYSVGALRRRYGIDSADYGELAAAAFHRYAFTDALTLGVRGQATRDLYNVGSFGTWQLPRLGIVGAGVSYGGRDGRHGPAATLAWSYTGTSVSVGLGTRYVSRDFPQLSDLESPVRPRLDGYASASVYSAAWGTLYATYGAFTAWEGPESRLWNVSWTQSVLAGKGQVALGYIRTLEPQRDSRWALSFRYFFDSLTSAVGAVGGARGEVAASATLERALPQGEGIGYSITAGRGIDGIGAGYGRGFVQANGAYATVGAEYERSSRPDRAPGRSRLFLAGSVGAVEGSWFAARPVQDSFAVIRVPGIAGVPVEVNGWYVGRTNAEGEVVATNVAAYYDNFVTFGSRDLPLDYAFDASVAVISPPARSGTRVEFAVRRQRALTGRLVDPREGSSRPLEFREIALVGEGRAIAGFTARRGEFYFEDVEPGRYRLRTTDGALCELELAVPVAADALTDVGAVACSRSSADSDTPAPHTR